MKKTWGLLLLVLTTVGCMHVEERVAINSDGSALVKTHLKVHAGTLQVVDTMFGGMLQAFASMGGKSDNSTPPPPESAAEKMFANKDDIVAKLKKSGLEASLESFESKKNDDGLLVDYTIKVADVIALTRSDILMTRVRIMRNAQGDWFCRAIADRKRKKEGQSQKVQFDKFQDSPQFQSMSPEMQKKIKDSIMDFKVEFLVAFPAPVTEATGLFEKKDDNTVGVGFSMDMLQNPQLFAKIASSTATQMARTGSGSAPADFFALAPGEEAEPDRPGVGESAQSESKVEAGKEGVHGQPVSSTGPGKVKIRLKNGTEIEGALLEKTDDFVKIDFEGITLTYYNDEIETIK